MTYNNDTTLLGANLLETKILINGTILDAVKGERCMYINIKDHFLVILIQDLEYVKVNYEYLLQDIRNRHNLNDKKLYIKIQKSISELK